MVLPLIILYPLAVGLAGAFVGAQIDDAIEDPTIQNTSADARVTTGDYIKMAVLAVAGVLAFKMARTAGLIK